jgi:hypothetical protein
MTRNGLTHGKLICRATLLLSHGQR